jgi:hypothetical protein
MFDFWLLSFFFILKINNFIDWGFWAVGGNIAGYEELGFGFKKGH